MHTEQGEIPRLSRKEYIILRQLVGGDEMYGLALVRESEGRLKRGTVYVTLSRMAEKGYVESRLEDKPAHVAGLPRRLYRPTGAGQRVLAAVEMFQATLESGAV